MIWISLFLFVLIGIVVKRVSSVDLELNELRGRIEQLENELMKEIDEENEKPS